MRLKTEMHAHDDENKKSKMDSDIDALMDKYEEAEKKPAKAKASPKK